MAVAGIVGAGLIGRAWAHVFARAGWQVRVWDPSPQSRETAAAAIAQSLQDLARHGLVTDPDAAARRVTVVAELADAVAGADYVQESGPEVLETKAATFVQLDQLASPRAILASSTSAIVASLFTERLPGRARCIVAHPVNPPHLVPVVELCGAPWTSLETRERARSILQEVGQVPIEVKKEIDGFILNRLQAALLSEAFRLVQEGYVSPQDLDHTVADGLGLRWAFMGPFETIELNAPGGIVDYCERYVPWFRRYAADPAPVSVWDDARWALAAKAWGRKPTGKWVTDRSRQRDARIAALVAHKRTQKSLSE